jgi:hypothetical protein
VAAVVCVVEHDDSRRSFERGRHDCLSPGSIREVVEHEIKRTIGYIWPQTEITARKVVGGQELSCAIEPGRVIVNRAHGAISLCSPEAEHVRAESGPKVEG